MAALPTVPGPFIHSFAGHGGSRGRRGNAVATVFQQSLVYCPFSILFVMKLSFNIFHSRLDNGLVCFKAHIHYLLVAYLPGNGRSRRMT